MKKLIKLFLVFGLIFLLGGCGKDIDVEQKEENQYKDHTLIEKEIADKIKIDAELSFPECENYYVMEATLWYPDAENIVAEFFDTQEYEIITEGLFTEYNDTGYRIQGTDSIAWGGYDGIYCDLKKEETLSYHDILSATLDEHVSYESNPLYIKENMEMFSESGIDGFEMGSCKQKVNRLMEQMGIQDYYDENPQVVAMDKNNMDKVKEASMYPDEDEVPDEGYFFLYSRELYGLPLYELSCPSNVSEARTVGCACMVEMYKNGDISMDATGMYEIGKKESADIIQPEAVLEKIEGKYGEVISETDIVIDEISLRYLPMQLKNGEPEFTIRPVWIFRTRENKIFGEEVVEWIDYSAIDAISGEWIF